MPSSTSAASYAGERRTAKGVDEEAFLCFLLFNALLDLWIGMVNRTDVSLSGATWKIPSPTDNSQPGVRRNSLVQTIGGAP